MASVTWWFMREIVPSSCNTGPEGLKLVELGVTSDVGMVQGTDGDGGAPS